MPVKIFCCYAHEDESLLNRLKSHLRTLQHQGFIDVWYDRDISAGTEWEQEISQQLNEAQIILLLISPDFMDSNYINNIELTRALERHEQGEARVIPVILDYVDWQIPSLRRLQALPRDGEPIAGWANQNQAFYNVTEGIRKVVEECIRKDKIDRVITALENPDYDWRTIEGVSKETHLPPEEVQNIIRGLGGQVRRSGTSRYPVLYTTQARYRRRRDSS